MYNVLDNVRDNVPGPKAALKSVLLFQNDLNLTREFIFELDVSLQNSAIFVVVR